MTNIIQEVMIKPQNDMVYQNNYNWADSFNKVDV